MNITSAKPADPEGDRAFDIDPTESPTALAPEAEAAQDAVEAAAQADATRARAKLLRDMAPAPAAPVAGPAAEKPFAPTRGKERWPVKTAKDDDIATVDTTTVQDTTVENLWLQERPNDMPLTRPVPAYQSNRAAPAETTVWRVEGTIIAYKWEQDGDFHIVLQSNDTGRTMIVETPETGAGADGEVFVDDGPLKATIADARKKIEEGLAARGPSPTPRLAKANIPVRVTGIGFFDIMHGQTGVAQTNAIELHPILDIEFLDSGNNGN